MQKYRYVGPCAAINTLLDGVEFEVARGETVEVSDEQAARLDDQSEIWKKVAPATPSTKDGGS